MREINEVLEKSRVYGVLGSTMHVMLILTIFMNNIIGFTFLYFIGLGFLILAIREYRRWGKAVGCWYKAIASYDYLRISIIIYFIGLTITLISSLILQNAIIWWKPINEVPIYYIVLIPSTLISSAYYGLCLLSVSWCKKIELRSRRLFKLAGLLNILFTVFTLAFFIILRNTYIINSYILILSAVALFCIKVIEFCSWYSIGKESILPKLLNDISLKELVYVISLALIGIGLAGTIAETSFSEHYIGTLSYESKGIGCIHGIPYYVKIYSWGDIIIQYQKYSIKHIDHSESFEHMWSNQLLINRYFISKEENDQCIWLSRKLDLEEICSGISHVYENGRIEGYHEGKCIIYREKGTYIMQDYYSKTAWYYNSSNDIFIELKVVSLTKNSSFQAVLECRNEYYSYNLSRDQEYLYIIKPLKGPCKLLFKPNRSDNIVSYRIVYSISVSTSKTLSSKPFYIAIVKHVIIRPVYKPYHTPYALISYEAVQGDLIELQYPMIYLLLGILLFVISRT